MRISWLIMLLPLAMHASLFGQAVPEASPESIKDPAAILAAAAPRYNFSDPSLKPWHFKASYQLYDESGQPAEQGEFEYWWASPGIYRTAWTRGSTVRSVWHTADGRSFETGNGEDLELPESDLPQTLLVHLPSVKQDHPDAHLARVVLAFGKADLPCVQWIDKGFGLTYCFDPKLPLLLAKTYPTGILEAYSNYALVQGRALPRTLVEEVENRKLLTATVEQISSLDAADPALIPPSGARPGTVLSTGQLIKITGGKLKKGADPDYPPFAKEAHLKGTVILEGTIDQEGNVRGLRVISSPARVLSDAGREAISHWKFQPFLRNGTPMEVHSYFNLVFLPTGNVISH